MGNFKKLFNLISYKERMRALWILLLISIMALLEMIGVASILPFMTVLTNPDLIETNYILKKMSGILSPYGVHTNEQFIFILGIIVFLLLITSQVFKIITTYAQVRFVIMREHSLGKKLLEGYIHQPYSWFLNRNSADLGKIILSEVRTIIFNGLQPLLELIARGSVVFCIILLLVLVDIKLSVIIGISLSGAYLIIFYIVRSYLRRNGEKRLINNELRFKAINEVFGAVKEVKFGGLEKNYIKIFSDSSQIYARAFAAQGVISQLPRFILEAIGFGGIMLLILYMMSQTGDFKSAIPVISLYVLAGYRLLPALQQMYSAFVQLTFVGPSLDKLSHDIKNLKPINKDQDQSILKLENSITLRNVSYSYPKSSLLALNNVSLKISSKSIIGIMGSTGSGKSTLVDIILGLLEPNIGFIEVDNKVINYKNLRSWQKSIGYVPQHIYLSDDTIAANIAFGVDQKDIDLKIVEKVSKIANLDEFIKNELPNKFLTTVGERGIRLSGGQRQRLGIARALYHEPKILILDEATSALDNQTEEYVMEAINDLSKDITIVIIAHRLNTMKNCDVIYKLEKGMVTDKYNFDELMDITR